MSDIQRVNIHHLTMWDLEYWAAKAIGFDVYHSQNGNCPVVAVPGKIWSTPMVEMHYDLSSSMYSLSHFLHHFKVEFKWVDYLGHQSLASSAMSKSGQRLEVASGVDESRINIYPRTACKALVVAYHQDFWIPIPEKEHRPSPKGLCFDNEEAYKQWYKEQS